MAQREAAEADDPPPAPPRAPEPWECCRSGCEPCIYDVYWDALGRYEAQLESWKARHEAAPAPPEGPR